MVGNEFSDFFVTFAPEIKYFMIMNTNQYLWLTNLLRRNSELTFKQIAEYWEVANCNVKRSKLGEKTFYNWRTKIAEEYKIYIECRRNKYYYIANPRAIESRASLNWMLESVAVHESIAESESMKDRILLENIPSCYECLTRIMEAMKDGKLMSMSYEKFNSDKHIPPIRFAPMCVKMHQRRWYVLAKLVDKEPKDDDPSPFKKYGLLRVYALDRIKALYTLDESFEFPQDFKPEDYFADFYGVFSNFEVPLERVLLKVPAYQCDWVKTLPLHHSQRIVEEHEDYTIFEYKMRIMQDFCRAILYQGLDTEVLAPESLRQEMAFIAEELNMTYHAE